MERQHFTQLLLENPNYFGTLPDSNLEAVQKIQYDTRYEQLECIGVFPEESTIAGTFKVKLPNGFRGGLCTPGSQEYFRFFIDWDNDGDFTDFNEDLGIASLNVHDILEVKKGALCYAVCKNFKSPQSSCHYPLVVRARVILSWQIPPTGPNFIPVWGNVLECWVQIAPTYGPQGLIAQIAQPTPSITPVCVDVETLPGCVGPPQKLGVKIVRTAAGSTFAQYDLKYSRNGGPWDQSGIIYPEPAPCGTSALVSPTDNLQKFNAVLGYLDSAYLLPPGIYEVILTVHDSGTGTAVATTKFDLQKNVVSLTKAGFADVFFDTSISRNILKVDGSEVSIGGWISITGSADVDGCGRIIKQYELSVSGDSYSPPAAPLPTAAVLWTNIVPPVDYTGPDHPYWYWCPGEFPNTINGGHLTKVWGTKGDPCPGQRYLLDSYWDTSSATVAASGGGRYVVRLKVEDKPVPPVVGAINTQYDSVIVWLDNKPLTVKLDGIEGEDSCEDLHLKKYEHNKARILGIAWDPLIIDTVPAPYTHPNDNFGHYSLTFAKDGQPPVSILPPDVPTPTTRVPNILPGPLPVALPAGSNVLANWDIKSAIDAGVAPSPYVPPPTGKLYRGEACTYTIDLYVSDTTRFGESGSIRTVRAIPNISRKIINDL